MQGGKVEKVLAYDNGRFGLRKTGGYFPSYVGGVSFRAELANNETVDFTIVSSSLHRHIRPRAEPLISASSGP